MTDIVSFFSIDDISRQYMCQTNAFDCHQISRNFPEFIFISCTLSCTEQHTIP